MSKIGIFPFLGRGHLNPLAALGRRLVREGHSVTVFHLAIARPAIKRAGLEFCRIDSNDPPGAVYVPTAIKGRPHWVGTREVVLQQIERVLREAPQSLKATGTEFMIVDQSDLAAGSVAEAMRIPFISIGCAPPIIMDSKVPLSYFDWGASKSITGRIKTAAANFIVRRVTKPLIERINVFRRVHALNSIRQIDDTLSPKAVITQIPKFFDLPRDRCPAHLFYTGPFRDECEDCVVSFPWDRLNGKPIVFASLGTVHNNDPRPFRIIAEACAHLDAQLVLSLGGGSLLPEMLGALAGKPIVVEYAPQREILKRACLVVNCAGLNTTLDAIASGVPILAIPIAEDQPGVAARIARAGIGKIVPFRHLSTRRLRTAAESILAGPEYRDSIKRLQQDFSQIDGVTSAAKILRQMFCL